MAGAEYEEKRGPNPGSRTIVRHSAEIAGTAGSLMGILQGAVNMKWLTADQAYFALGVLTIVGSIAFKAWSDLGMTARLRKLLDRKLPSASILLPFLIVPLLGGCAIQLGTMEPKQFSTLGGGTLIACDTKGIAITFGDADLCSNSARGGHVSKTFSEMILGIVRTAGAAVAGIFSGFGQAGAAMQAALPAAPQPAAPAPAEPTVQPSPTPDAEGSFLNPFGLWEGLPGDRSGLVELN